MKLVLITCCKTKATGGEPYYQPSTRLKEGLSPTSYDRLMIARRELAEMLGEAPGPDLSFTQTASGLTFLPAYRRYVGRVYQAARVANLYPRSCLCLIIISALYGLLDADDLIRLYDLRMDSKVGNYRVSTFWQKHRLGEIICEYINCLQPKKVHDLLIDGYRKALKPWPRCLQEMIEVKPYKYPGQGIGAMYRRGEDLEKLLKG